MPAAGSPSTAKVCVGLRAKFHPPDVADARDVPVAAGLDDDVLELTDVVEAARHVQSDLESLAARDGRHTDLAGRNGLALLLQRLDHVLRGEAAGLELFLSTPRTASVPVDWLRLGAT